MEVYFGQKKKRDNSTSRLDTSEMTLYHCTILRGSGMMNPKIEMDVGLVTDPSIYNVAHIPDFGNRWYFVREWYFENSLWVAYLEVDVLATYKTAIGDTSLYILRAANEFNGDIADVLYPVKTGCSYSRVAKTTPWKGVDQGFFVLGIVSRDGQFGSITYYAVNRSSMAALVSRLVQTTITQNNGFNWDDASQALQKAVVDPLQYIRSCVFIPRPLSDIPGTSVSSIPVFDWTVNASAKIPSVTEDYVTLSYNLPQHPDSGSRGNYLNSAPYTVMTINIPPFGVIELDTSVTCNSANVQVDIHIDIFTGRAVLEIICQNEVLNAIEAQVGVPIQLSQVSRDYMGAAMSALGSIAAGVGGSFIGAASGIGNAMAALVPRSNTIGSQGSFTALNSTAPFELSAQFFRPVADDPTHNGRPLCATRKPVDLGGYMLVQDGDVRTRGTREEDQRIREYLESGFYFE